MISRSSRSAARLSAASLALLFTACGSDPAAPPADDDSTRTWTSVVAGSHHSCALDAQGAAYCWGLNMVGQLGTTGEQDRATPAAVLGTQRYAALAAGDRFTCGLALDGKAWCWGDNSFLQLGATTPGYCLGVPCSRTPVAVMGGRTYTAIAAGGNHVCALAAGGAAWCWGDNGQGQLGVDFNAPQYPVAVQGGLAFTSITATTGTSCGLAGTTAYCWGLNSQGQLGAVTEVDVSDSPVAVSGGLAFSSLSAGGFHLCGTTVSNGVFCWGANEYGEMGIGSTTPWDVPQPAPIQVAGLTASAVASGQNHSCSLGADGAIRCWGANGAGQLGAESAETCGAQSCATTPAARVGTHTFASLALGGQHSCAITADNRLFCWGSNGSGQLGSGPVGSSRITPSEVQ